MLCTEAKFVAVGVGMTWRESHPDCSASLPQEYREQCMESDNSMNTPYHKPVLLGEVIEYMRPTEGKLIVDATLGGGGHTEAMLQAGAQVIGVDQDEQAHEFAAERLKSYSSNFTPLRGNFSDLPEILEGIGVNKVDGILIDIGVSSWQLDEASRGFSFGKEGPLDMRMDRSCGETAADLVNHLPELELRTIFYEYGEERAGSKIARRIVERRQEKPFTTTTDLADFIALIQPRAKGPAGKIHPATRVFQALRIAVNDELGVLRSFLDNASKLLNPGGRLVVITFHSLEDRIVKQYFRHASQSHIDRKEWPEPRPNPDYHYQMITRRPVTAGEDELIDNKRSRSAKLRVVEKR
jgi:16S rRNA (cytosine1402-N4)-methyltransferase